MQDLIGVFGKLDPRDLLVAARCRRGRPRPWWRGRRRARSWRPCRPSSPVRRLPQRQPDDYLAGFPWHPHRGHRNHHVHARRARWHTATASAITGNLGAGDVQWMTAGSGILHQEMPKGDAQGRMHGFQLWANLPASLKMTAPRYQDVVARDIPEVVDDDGTGVRVICGSSGARRGRLTASRPIPRYLDVSVPPGQQAPGGRYVASRVRLCVRGLRHVPRRLRTARRCKTESRRRC